MKTITVIEATYLRPNVTIEQLMMNEMGEMQMHYLINEKGISYRYFTELGELLKYFSDGEGEHQVFESDKAFDDYMEGCGIEFV
jgi:hypothetical protein